MACLEYDLIYLLCRVWQETGTFDTEKVIKALEGISFEGVLGDCYLGGKEKYGADRSLFYPLYVNIFKDGEWVTVEKLKL